MLRGLHYRTVVIVGVLGVLLPVATPTGATTRAGGDPPASCRGADTAVMLNGSTPVSVHGELCRPPGAPPDTVHILIHGGTYNRGYWNFTFEPATYSYARSARRFVAFSYDRVGFGRSTRRPSAELTGMTQADVLRQLVAAFRAGRIDGHAYRRVVLVGHSLGSGIALLEAATYRDVDGVVLTGITHHISPQQMYDTYFNHLHPADEDPRFAGRGYDAGFLTTRPGVRDDLFYTPDLSDPAVIAADEDTKDVVSSAEIFDIVSLAFDSHYSRRINVPVLMVVGSRDFLFCRGAAASDCSSSEALTAEEAPYFSPEACFRAEVLPGVGHDVTLHTVSPRLRELIGAWAEQHASRTCPTTG
jgi:pimeloyl-ACP methyl ester carboxylesterase